METPKKCEYLGWYSRDGCDEDSVEGLRFCHKHRVSGPSNEVNRKIFVGCLVAAIALGIFCFVYRVAVSP
jgi:hypothetical protein